MALILRAIVLIFAFPLCAKDLGVRGHIFPISEESLSNYLQSKLSHITPQELARIEENTRAHYLKLAEHPPGKALPEAKNYRLYYFDPTIQVAHDILDHQGKVIVAKGAEINPLKIVSVSQELLFFDGTKEAHIQWAKLQNANAKWILISGSPLKLEQQEKRPVYFDQFGALSAKLSIQNVPAKVSCDREQHKLQIEEIPCENS